ncbi:hypothetical protein [Legionella fallonii]|uniref:Membrane-associated HD superfamily hydrolase n=1 Tax=Legionella fallonii LLAP-10 TaxID=1212491 RepID=A0A098G686_9GAMM|nr:hypothetical protein [Legionella fallonii]CEG57020.1 conserved protein of unknown function [Legionella fallonii LLAP-10]
MTRAKDTEMQNKLKEIREKEELNAVEVYKQKLAQDRASARAAELDELRRSLVIRHDDKGNPITAWDDWIGHVEKATSEAAAAYNSEWKISMLNLLNTLGMMVQAVDGKLEENLRMPLKQAVIDGLILGKIKDSFIKPPSEISLPSLEHNVTFTDDNKLKIAPLMRSDLVDNKDLLTKERQQLEDAFEKGVVKWLKDNGYKPHPTEEKQFVHETTGKLLDKAAFVALKNDPDNGLQNFLSETTDLSFTPSR